MDKYIHVLTCFVCYFFCTNNFLHQHVLCAPYQGIFLYAGFFLSQTYFITNVNKVQTTIILFLFKKDLSCDVSLESLILR